MLYGNNLKWHDAPCQLSFKFICHFEGLANSALKVEKIFETDMAKAEAKVMKKGGTLIAVILLMVVCCIIPITTVGCYAYCKYRNSDENA